MAVAEEVRPHLKLDHPALPRVQTLVQEQAQAQARARAQAQAQAQAQAPEVDQQELPLV